MEFPSSNVGSSAVKFGLFWACKLHLAADSAMHEIIYADLSLSATTNAQALPDLINQTHRKIREASADGAYDTVYCHDALLRKKIRPLIPPRRGAQYWPDRYHERNHAVANQRLSGSNDTWKKKVGYHRRSVAETAMFRFKTLLGGYLSLRDYDGQVGEAMAIRNAEQYSHHVTIDPYGAQSLQVMIYSTKPISG